MTGYLPDANVWFALALEPHVHHRAAIEWFDGVGDTDTVAFCRPTQQALLRLLTSARLMQLHGLDPLSNADAWAIYQAFVADTRVRPPGPEPAGVERDWHAYAARQTASPKLWMDAYLAAVARSAALTMVTSDKAFQQFSALNLQLIEA